MPRVYWNWPTVADEHPDSPALDLLSDILAGGEASRLHKALVREARIAKDVSADSDTKEAAGLFQIQSTAAEADDPAKGLDAIEAALKAQIEAIQKDAPSAEELARALARHEKTTLAVLTQPLMRAVVLGVGLAENNDANHYRKDYERYFKVTTEDLKRVAKTYLTPDKVVLWIEPMGPDWSKMPAPSEMMAFHAPKFVKATLKNGIRVWVAPWKTLPVVSARLVIPSGTGDDPEGKSGLASLSATMLEQGTKTKTATELAEALDTLGASLGFSIDSDHTTLNLLSLSRNLDPTLALMGEVLSSPEARSERGLPDPRATVAARLAQAGAGQRAVDCRSRLPHLAQRGESPLRQPVGRL